LARFTRAEHCQSQVLEKRNLGACDASQERVGEMDRSDLTPRPARDIKHAKLALMGLAGQFWPISTPLIHENGNEVKWRMIGMNELPFFLPNIMMENLFSIFRFTGV
jgi:hypothetical protein